MTSEQVLALCAAVVTVFGAYEAVKKAILPALNFGKRLDAVEMKLKNDYERLKQTEETSKLLCSGMLCLLDVAERQTGDSPANQERIKRAKSDIQNHLLGGLVQDER